MRQRDYGITKPRAVALANKTARTAWALMKTGESYRAPTPAAG